MNALSGASGIGKTTILRDILPSQLESYQYITQKPIRGNEILQWLYTKLSDEVRNYYAIKLKRARRFFHYFKTALVLNVGEKEA